MTAGSVLAPALALATAMLLVAVALVAWRMMRGPGIADRLVAMDMLGLLGVAFGGVAGLYAWHAAFLDVALGVALIGFLGAVAFAGFVEAAAQGSARDAQGRGGEP